MTKQSAFYLAVEEITGLLQEEAALRDSARSAGKRDDGFTMVREIAAAVLLFATGPAARAIDCGDTDGEISRLGHAAGLALVEKFRGNGGSSQGFFSAYTWVKSYYTKWFCQKITAPDQLRQGLLRLDVFFGGLAAGFSQGWLRSVKGKFRGRLQEAKRHLLQEKKRYATVFAQMNEPAFVVDQNLRLIDLNPAGEKFFGIQRDELQGKTCCGLIGRENCVSCPLAEIIVTGGSFSNLELTVFGPAAGGAGIGETKTILMAGTALGDFGDGNRGGIVIFQDVTERKKNEEELDVYRNWLEDLVDERTEELLGVNKKLQAEIAERHYVEKELVQVTASLKRSNAELEQFAHVASHDLQEPLMLVASFADRLMARYGASFDERGRDYLARIIKGTQKLQQLVAALLQLSRVSTSTANFTPVDMNELVREVVADLEEIIIRSGARVDIALLPELVGDAVQLRQLFQNLISNAIKYHRENVLPFVSISSRVVGNSCEIKVEDNGIGFNEKDGERIFEPFVRLHGLDKYEGTGMGLTTCKKIVARHGGEITAQGKLERGAVFVVRFPLPDNNFVGQT